jgi:hypothetical protein
MTNSDNSAQSRQVAASGYILHPQLSRHYQYSPHTTIIQTKSLYD